MKAVFDTNIFISAFVFPGGRGEEAYLKAVKGKFQLVSSLAILAEVANKLKDKFYWDEGMIRAALKNISRVAEIKKIEPYLSILSDEPDNRIIECAEKGEAGFIVTGDKHLLSLKKYKKISIVTLSNFLFYLEDESRNING
jgi:putative PIN family toxin of toxin-antitoxin system